MKEQLTRDDFLALVRKLADDVIAAQEGLTTLDAAIGDGDLGVTLTIGFREIKRVLAKTDLPDIASILLTCSTAFAEKAASTFGALLTTMFSRAGVVARGKEVIGARESAEMLRAASDGVRQRGGAELGDKTLLDALIPAVEALEKAAGDGLSLAESAGAALTAAREGAERTIGLRARTGRSGYLGDRTIGVKDPGAAAIVIILESVAAFISAAGLAE